MPQPDAAAVQPSGRTPGRSFYAAPGPTNIPDSVLQACAQATTDFMAPAFAETYATCVAGLRRILGTRAMALHFYASSGHGAWEATFANLFSPGDTVLMLESGVFSGFWSGIGSAFGIDVQTVTADWRRGVDPAELTRVLRADPHHRIAAVCVVHNDTASGVTIPPEQIRACLDDAGHPALLLLDVVSSAGSLELLLDEWRVDAAVGSSQKGLMMLPGIGFTAVSPRAMQRHRTATLPRAYFDWSRMQARPHLHSAGTVPAGLFNGLRQALSLIDAEGLPQVFARHRRLGGAVQAAIHAWHGNAGHKAGATTGDGPQLYCRDPARASFSVSAILLPPGFVAAPLRATAARLHVTLGADLGLFDDRLFRIGHMGDLNEAMVLGILGVAEIALSRNGIPHATGLPAALDALSLTAPGDQERPG